MGPRDIVTNSVAGATAGYSLMWVLLLALLIRVTMLDVSARYVMVTGETLLAGCGRLGRKAVLVWFGATILRRHVAELLTLTLMGTAGDLMFPLPTPHSATIWRLVSWTVGFALVFWGRYKAIEYISKPLTAITAGCVVLAVIASKPDFGRFLSGVTHPALPTDAQSYSPAVVVMGLLAASMGSFSSVRYSAYVHEKGWRSVSFRRSQTFDMLLSMLGMFAVLALMQVAAAELLRPRGVQIRDIGDLVPIFSTVLGNAGRVLFGLTLWSVSFSACVGNGTGYGIMLSDVYYRFIRPNPDVIESGKPVSELPAYRWMILYMFLSPLYVLATGWSAVTLVYIVGLANLVTLPIVAVMMFRLTTDKKVMGAYVNGWFSNLVLIVAVICALFLAWQGGQDLIQDLRSR
jgi:Mn2+/Fe2+ NRAMP family transporter